MRLLPLAFAVSSLLACLPASADTLIYAGQLLDRPGQPPRGASTLRVREGKVVEVREGHLHLGDFGLLDGQVIDLRQHFVLPGLIDSHVHLTSDRGGIEAQLAQVRLSAADAAFDAQMNARKTLMAGFTTVRNLGDADGVIRALRDAVNAGKLIGPRILTANTSISATAGHADPTLGFRPDLRDALERGGNVCDGADACRRAVRTQIAQGADVIKMTITGGVNSRIGAGLGAQMFEDEARAVIETAHMYDKKVAVHAHGADGINLALRLGADSIEHGTLLDEAGIKLFRESGAYYVPTLSTVNGYKQRLAANAEAYQGTVFEKIQWRIGITGKSLEKAMPAGVKIAFGTDAGVSLHGRNADEFELMVAHGMSPAQAIAAATVNAADLLGLASEVGALTPGMAADLIAVQGDPLSDVQVLKQVDWVIKGGVVIKRAGAEAAP
jgi:imidazolonepropionase-like amidohydrolase